MPSHGSAATTLNLGLVMYDNPIPNASGIEQRSAGGTTPAPGPDARKLDWALWALDHTRFYVFPLRPNDKPPLFEHWNYHATRDPKQVKRWWAAHPEANIGYAYFRSGHCMIDLDVKHPPINGVETWRALCQEHGETPTFSLRSGSGGFHIVYADPDGYVPTKGAIWRGIDTRGMNGFGVGLGSTIDGKAYAVEHDAPIAELPQWIKDHFGKTYAEKQEMVRVAAPIAEDEWDRPLSIDYAIEAIEADIAENGPPRIGDGSDGRAYEMCQRLLDYALTDATIVELLRERWQPTFSVSWYKEKLGNAHHYRQNAIGCDRPMGAAERFGDAIADHLARIVAEQKARREKYQFRTPEEDANVPPLEFWDEHKTLPRLPSGCSVIAYGPTGSHKTGVALKYCLDAVLNKGARVLYLAPEGAHGIRTTRLRIACRHRGKTLPDLSGHWHTMSTTPRLMIDGEIDELIEACRQNGFHPDIVVIDTLTRAAHGYDISAPQTGEGLITGMERLAAAFDAAVVAITHPGKDSTKGSIGSSLIESLAYAIWKITLKKATEEITLRVEKMKDGEADFSVHFAVERDERRVPVIVDGKAPVAPPAAEASPLDAPTASDHQSLRDRVIDALRLHTSPLTTARLSVLLVPKEPDENGEDHGRRLEALAKRLQRNAAISDKGKAGKLADLVQRARNGDMLYGGRWYLPDNIRNFAS
jgi:hypothetical protein